jgi:hypothetical protein
MCYTPGWDNALAQSARLVSEQSGVFYPPIGRLGDPYSGAQRSIAAAWKRPLVRVARMTDPARNICLTDAPALGEMGFRPSAQPLHARP